MIGPGLYSAPSVEERAAMAASAPPMRGAEYLSADVLEAWWLELDQRHGPRWRLRESASRNFWRNGTIYGGWLGA